MSILGTIGQRAMMPNKTYAQSRGYMHRDDTQQPFSKLGIFNLQKQGENQVINKIKYQLTVFFSEWRISISPGFVMASDFLVGE